jgi:hypothetical protein
MKIIDQVDIGDSVQCDLCNKEFRGSEATGGFLFMSKGVCPECAPKFEAEVIKCCEQEFIKARCPEGMSFHQFIMEVRAGDNTITVYTL